MKTLKKVEHYVDVLKQCFPEAECIETNCKMNNIDSEYITSSITHLRMEYKQDEQRKIKHLIMKVPECDETYKFFSKFDLYVREKYMYEMIVPLMSTYIEDQLVPIHYRTTETELLILNDLAVNGYQSAKRREFCNFDESVACIQTLAKFHSVSFKICQEYPHFLDEPLFKKSIMLDFRKNIINLTDSLMNEISSSCLNSNLGLHQKFRTMNSLMNQTDEQIYSRINRHNFKFVVLNHGDYRKENLLLKRDSKGSVEDVKIIDLQGCWWSSPAFDLFFFLSTSVHYKEVEKNFDEFLDCYIENLNKMLLHVGCANKYSKNDLIFDLKKERLMATAIFLCGCTNWVPQNLKNLKEFTGGHLPLERNADELVIGASICWLKIYEKLGIFESLEAGTSY